MNPNDPAFPSEKKYQIENPFVCDSPVIEVPKNFGLTKREYFAAMAMQGFLTSRLGENSDVPVETVVKASLVMADALIAELSKGGPT